MALSLVVAAIQDVLDGYVVVELCHEALKVVLLGIGLLPCLVACVPGNRLAATREIRDLFLTTVETVESPLCSWSLLSRQRPLSAG